MADCYDCANSTSWGVCQHCNGQDPKGELSDPIYNSGSCSGTNTTYPQLDPCKKYVEALCAISVAISIIVALAIYSHYY